MVLVRHLRLGVNARVIAAAFGHCQLVWPKQTVHQSLSSLHYASPRAFSEPFTLAAPPAIRLLMKRAYGGLQTIVVIMLWLGQFGPRLWR